MSMSSDLYPLCLSRNLLRVRAEEYRANADCLPLGPAAPELKPNADGRVRSTIHVYALADVGPTRGEPTNSLWIAHSTDWRLRFLLRDIHSRDRGGARRTDLTLNRPIKSTRILLLLQ
jgi:hypothetical protein